ncbi:hypothetical protein Tco_1569711 [Tanacetum coccineum]
MEMKTSSRFKTTGLLQSWQTLCKIFSKCLTTRVTGWDQPPLQIMKMLYCSVNNIHEIKDKVGMKNPIDDIKKMKNTGKRGPIIECKPEVFVEFLLTQSQPTESTQGTHRTPSAPRSPNPKMDTAESSAPKRSTVIHFCLPERRSTRLTPPALVPTVDKADEMILQDTLQISLAEHKSREEQEARENVELVKEHLATVEIEKMMEGSVNVIDDSLLHKNDDPKIPGTRLEPRSDKESPEVEINKDKEVEITNDEEVEITNVVIPVNVNEEEEEITDEVYELKRREKGKIVEESRSTPFPSIRSPRFILDPNLRIQGNFRNDEEENGNGEFAKAILQEHGNIHATISSQYQKAIDNHIPSQVDASPQDIAIWLALQMKFESLQVPQTTCRTSVVRPRDQDDPHDDAHPEGENRGKRQNTSEYEAYVSGVSSVIRERVHDFQLGIESYQQKVNLTTPTISFPGIEKYKMFSIIYELVHGIIYKNSKKEKRVMRHSEIHKDLTNEEVEYLKLFEEEIEVSKSDEKMGDVNGRPLGPRRERPE